MNIQHLTDSLTNKLRVGLKILVALAACAGLARAQDEPAAPEPTAEALEAPYVLFVNVGNALDSESFGLAVEHVRAQMTLNPQTAELESSIVPSLAANPKGVRDRFGERVALAVFIENQPDGYFFLQAPRAWAMVNLHGFDRDDQEPDTRLMRLKKLFLKGLAHAAGGGSNPDRRCVMWNGSHTLEGMDRTSPSLGPYAFFPLLDTLVELGVQGAGTEPNP